MRKRRSFEAGHRPKFLVIVDDTPEADRALYFAAKRAARLGSGLVTLNVIQQGETQVWLGVGDIMKAEAMAAAQRLLEKAAERARDIAGIEPERIVREGITATEIANLIEEDEDISILVLASSIGSEGPGPLVAALASKTGLASKSGAGFPIPVTIVPGGLADEEIDALAG
jgi:nucleotide-binding universal stress UspA family protein